MRRFLNKGIDFSVRFSHDYSKSAGIINLGQNDGALLSMIFMELEKLF